MSKTRNEARQRRQRRVRGKVSGTADKPRLNVYRSLANIYAQLIDDGPGHTLVSASTIDPEVVKQIDGLNGVARAKVVGKVLAERARQAGADLDEAAEITNEELLEGFSLEEKVLLKRLLRDFRG